MSHRPQSEKTQMMQERRVVMRATLLSKRNWLFFFQVLTITAWSADNSSRQPSLGPASGGAYGHPAHSYVGRETFLGDFYTPPLVLALVIFASISSCSAAAVCHTDTFLSSSHPSTPFAMARIWYPLPFVDTFGNLETGGGVDDSAINVTFALSQPGGRGYICLQLCPRT